LEDFSSCWGNASVTITVADNPTPPMVVETRISSGNDDVEERLAGSIDLTSSDLELVDDNPSKLNQTIGLRFNGLDIPQGAIITNAYIQFQGDEADAGAATLQIHGEDTDDAAAFSSSSFDVSSRSLTSATVTWTPPEWTTVGAASVDQQTADTMVYWMIRCGDLIEPLIAKMHATQIGYDIVLMDETTVQVLKEKGRAPQSKSYMWVRRGGPPDQTVILFDYDPSRGGNVPARLLEKFRGILQTDGYAAMMNGTSPGS
jgi:hypothetical protein